jgi:hypothetical protein
VSESWRESKSENRSSRAHRDLVTRNRDPRFRDKIWTVHIRGHVAEICHRGKSRQGVSPSVFEVHREIGNPGDK